MTVERGVFRGNPFIHPFLDFFVTEVCIRKCMLHQSEEVIIRRCHVWRVCWMRENFPFKL